ncbi:M24 family metallopeptidase [Paenactinomyces guangxiensis]|uniref:M24 family metallopeptidase n=1 Tax=Paenactinomyces guangxiensis TaxID=1490290 RepID=A0A7W1WQQ8_9BACL|nr:M24 family metallopeptidase [Paenactinomyces guangxiensis]MBA4494203.1 M24 family metallopeptidase [Paenactinomyces guangxiensis]MBH8590699.1 M24 family metallopeptidase [Paenactinomyces guangxiensis]
MSEQKWVNQKLDRIRHWLGQKGLDGVLLCKKRNFSWLTCGKANHIELNTEQGVADLLITQNRAICITTRMEAERIASEELDGLGFEMVVSEWIEGREKTIQHLCRGKKIATDVSPELIGLDQGICLDREIARLSYALTDEEAARYRNICLNAAKALESTCREIEPDMTEFEIQATLAKKVFTRGMRPVVMLVATDERIYRFRHPIPTSKRLQTYAMLVLCAEQSGLIANMTRFVHFGPLSPELSENRYKLAQIDVAMNSATRPGTEIKQVFQSGIRAYQEAGHGEDWHYLHQGGPTGYATREFLATPDCEGVVQLNQAFAWNPSIRGLKSEDTILVKEEHNEILTHTDEWIYITIKKDGQEFKRPDILIR